MNIAEIPFKSTATNEHIEKALEFFDGSIKKGSVGNYRVVYEKLPATPSGNASPFIQATRARQNSTESGFGKSPSLRDSSSRYTIAARSSPGISRRY
jgi:hypothetical protein